MKRYMLTAAIILIICLALIGCSDSSIDPPEEDIKANSDITTDYSSYYIFDLWNGKLLKYNVLTGTATSAHLDPLCDHNHADCPVSLITGQIAVSGNFVYFVKNDWERDASGRSTGSMRSYLYQYDYINDRLALVIPDFSVSNFAVVGDYIYSHNYTLLENGDTGLEFLRHDIKTGVTTVLIDAEEAENMLRLPLFCRLSGDRAYWYIIDETGMHGYSTAYDYSDMQSESLAMVGIVQGDYAYIPERNYELTYPVEYYKWFSSSLYRESLNDGSRILLSDHLSVFSIEDDNIIYFVPVKDPKVTYESTTNPNHIYHDNYEGKIYIMNTDGSNKRLLCEVPDVTIYGYMNWVTNHMRAQDWIGVNLYGDMSGRFEDRSGLPNIRSDPQGYGILPDLLLVNIKTGEYKITEYIP
jgi:hypothetical protein